MNMHPIFAAIVSEHIEGREKATKAVAPKGDDWDDDCPEECDKGKHWNNADPTSGQWADCETCAAHAAQAIEGCAACGRIWSDDGDDANFGGYGCDACC